LNPAEVFAAIVLALLCSVSALAGASARPLASQPLRREPHSREARNFGNIARPELATFLYKSLSIWIAKSLFLRMTQDCQNLHNYLGGGIPHNSFGWFWQPSKSSRGRHCMRQSQPLKIKAKSKNSGCKPLKTKPNQ